VESIIAAIIAGVLAGGASVYASRAANDKLVAVLTERLDNHKEQTARQIDELSERVDKHNNLVERMVVQEMSTEAQWKRIDEMRADIENFKIGGTR
jgi:predicted patatin/cPLA2 family phospholipase